MVRQSTLPLVLISWLLSVPLFSAGAAPADRFFHIASVSADGVLHAQEGDLLILADLRLPAAMGKRWSDQQATAVALISELTAGHRFAGTSYGHDRWGRLCVSLVLDGGNLAVILLERGLAVVDARDDGRVLAPLFVAEAEARAAGAGLWGLGYRVRSASGQVPRQGFGIVEGVVTDVARVRGRIYVNFGADYHEDFTVLLEGDVDRRFKADSIPPESLKGKHVRVRGMLEDWNGPLMRLTSPRSLEILPSIGSPPG